MTSAPGTTITEIIGVYDADGSLRGELAYVIGKVRGTAHCALCDITHSGVRRRKGFAELPARLGVPFALLHRDERSADLLAFTQGRAPIVVGRTAEGFVELLVAEDLAHIDTNADGLFDALSAALSAKGLRLAA